MDTHQKLEVWQKSIVLVKDIYATTEKFPESEKFGLINQLRRCAVSVPSNIAEGYGRKSDGDFVRFLRIAYGSTAELDTQLIIVKELRFLSEGEFGTLIEQLTSVRKMLNKLMSAIAKN